MGFDIFLAVILGVVLFLFQHVSEWRLVIGASLCLSTIYLLPKMDEEDYNECCDFLLSLSTIEQIYMTPYLARNCFRCFPFIAQ